MTGKMKKIINLFLIAVFAFTVAELPAQTTKAQKKAEQKKEEQKARSAKAEKQGKKKHLKLQTKDVQKRMKRNKKRYHHVESFDNKPNLWRRIFPRKRPSAY